MRSVVYLILGNIVKPAFHFAVSGDPEKEVDLEQYFSDKGVLHCTTKFCDYGKEQGAKEYMEKQVGPNSAVKLAVPRSAAGRAPSL